MANFPTSLDTGVSLPNPSTSNNTNNPSHAGLHAAENAAIIAAETKLGTGASTPTSNTILFGTGSGTSSWTALTSSQLAAILSDETGTGSAVFANTPTLITPKVDTINENTVGNGVTVGGVNLKSGVVGANAVATASIAAGAVTNAKLSTTAGEIGAAWSSWTPAFTGYSANPAGGMYFWNRVGKQVTISVAEPNNGTSNATTVTLSLPVAAITRTSFQWTAPAKIIDNGVAKTSPGLATINSGASTVTVVLDYGFNAFTTSGGKRIDSLVMTYEAA